MVDFFVFVLPRANQANPYNLQEALQLPDSLYKAILQITFYLLFL